MNVLAVELRISNISHTHKLSYQKPAYNPTPLINVHTILSVVQFSLYIYLDD